MCLQRPMSHIKTPNVCCCCCFFVRGGGVKTRHVLLMGWDTSSLAVGGVWAKKMLGLGLSVKVRARARVKVWVRVLDRVLGRV